VNSEKIGKIRKKSGWWWWCWQTFVRNIIIEINNVIMKMAGKGQITSERASYKNRENMEERYVE
jgi:hypothetical protein